jgi:hypothetical protein
MVKRISYLIISLAIIVIGIIAFNRLNFWERSVRIFEFNSEQFTGGRGSGGRPGFDRNFNRENQRERFERPNTRYLPDSANQRDLPEPRFRSQQDSLNLSNPGLIPGVRNNFNQRGFIRNSRPGGDFRRGRNIQLRNVYWFLAVFALFTAGTVYLDKFICFFKKRTKANSPINYT